MMQRPAFHRQSVTGTSKIVPFKGRARRATWWGWFLSFCQMMHPLLQDNSSSLTAAWSFTDMRAEKQIGFESGLELGLRNMWYPVCQAAAVKERPVGLHRL